MQYAAWRLDDFNVHRRLQEVHFDEASGRVHDFCTRRHADEAVERGQWAQPGNDPDGGGGARARCASC